MNEKRYVAHTWLKDCPTPDPEEVGAWDATTTQSANLGRVINKVLKVLPDMDNDGEGVLIIDRQEATWACQIHSNGSLEYNPEIITVTRIPSF